MDNVAGKPCSSSIGYLPFMVGSVVMNLLMFYENYEAFHYHMSPSCQVVHKFDGIMKDSSSKSLLDSLYGNH